LKAQLDKWSNFLFAANSLLFEFIDETPENYLVNIFDFFSVLFTNAVNIFKQKLILFTREVMEATFFTGQVVEGKSANGGRSDKKMPLLLTVFSTYSVT
jgi:hypothetical protein